MHPTRASRAALLAILLISLGSRLLWLDHGALAHDEPFTVYWSQQPADALRAMLRTENNPPLHFVITRAWSRLVPFEPEWLRLPSAVASALLAWPVFLIALRLGSLRAALTASLLIVLSNFHHGFANEVRAYALFTLLGAWSAWLLVRMAAADRKPSALPLALVWTLLVYTHFFGWLMIGLQCLMALAWPAARVRWRTLLASLLFTLVAFSPYFLVFALRARTSIAEGTWLEAPAWEEPYNMVWRWSNAPVLAVAFLVLTAAALFRNRLAAPLLRIAFIWTMAPLLGMFAVSFAVPIYLDRYLAFAAPGFALLVAAGIDALRIDRRWAHALAAMAVMGMALTFRPAGTKRYAPEGVARQVAEWCGDECHVEVVPAWYWLNLLAAQDIASLRRDQSHLLRGSPHVPDAGQAAALGPTVLVDGSGSAAFARLKDQYRTVYAEADSVEADHRVWVHRYRSTDPTPRP